MIPWFSAETPVNAFPQAMAPVRAACADTQEGSGRWCEAMPFPEWQWEVLAHNTLFLKLIYSNAGLDYFSWCSCSFCHLCIMLFSCVVFLLFTTGHWLSTVLINSWISDEPLQCTEWNLLKIYFLGAVLPLAVQNPLTCNTLLFLCHHFPLQICYILLAYLYFSPWNMTLLKNSQHYNFR